MHSFRSIALIMLLSGCSVQMGTKNPLVQLDDPTLEKALATVVASAEQTSSSGNCSDMYPEHLNVIDYLSQKPTYADLVPKIKNRSLITLEEARLLSTGIQEIFITLDPTKVLFPPGDYFVAYGFKLNKSIREIIGCNKPTIDASGRASTISDISVIRLHPDVHSLDDLKNSMSGAEWQTVTSNHSFFAQFYFPIVAGAPGRTVNLRNFTIDLKEPPDEHSPAFLERWNNLPIRYGVLIENPLNSVVSGLHILNTPSGGINLRNVVPKQPNTNYGTTYPTDCMTTPFHKPTDKALLDTSTPCFLQLTDNKIQQNIIEMNDRSYVTISGGVWHNPSFGGIGIILSSERITSEFPSLTDTFHREAERRAGYPSYSYLPSVGKSAIAGNVIRGGVYGVMLANSPLNSVTNNFVVQTTHRGISAQHGSDYTLISNNFVAGAGGAGIHNANDTDFNQIHSNTVSYSGFLVDSNGAVIRDSAGKIMVLGGEGDGLKAYVNTHGHIFSKNIVLNSRASGIRIGHHTTKNKIEDNSISYDPSFLIEVMALGLRPQGMRLSSMFYEQTFLTCSLPVTGDNGQITWTDAKAWAPCGIGYNAQYEGEITKTSLLVRQSEGRFSENLILNNKIGPLPRGIVISDDSNALRFGTAAIPTIVSNSFVGNRIKLLDASEIALGIASLNTNTNSQGTAIGCDPKGLGSGNIFLNNVIEVEGSNPAEIQSPFY